MVPLPNPLLGWTGGFARQTDSRRVTEKGRNAMVRFVGQRPFARAFVPLATLNFARLL